MAVTAPTARLLRQSQIAATDLLWLGRGQCIEQYGAGEVYLPLLEAVGQLGRAPDRARLVALLRHQAPSWLLHLPALVPATELDALQQRSSGTTRERMLRELAETVETLSADRPLVLVLEDLHWSDGATLEWLMYVARRRAAARLLVLGTYRPVEAAVRAHPVRTVVQELQMHNDAQELALGYLQESEIVSYLTQRFGRAALPEGFARFLHQRTTGNPLFLVTIVDALVQQGVLRHGVTGWELSGGVETAATGVPESLRQLIERQLEQLAPEDQVLLEVASVAGQEFAVAAVAAGLERAVDEVEARCAVLARRGQFVRVCGTDEWADGMVATRYGFLHDLYRATVYDRFPAGRRVRWHRQVGARLEAGYGTRAREMAAELAMHFVQGREAQKYAGHRPDASRPRAAPLHVPTPPRACRPVRGRRPWRLLFVHRSPDPVAPRYPDQAGHMSLAALALAQAFGHPYSLAHALIDTATISQFRRDVQSVSERAEAILALGHEHGFRVMVAQGTILRGWARALQQSGAGMAQMRQGLADLHAMGTEHFQPWFRVPLVEACGQAGLIDEGCALLDDALRITHATGERVMEGELYRLKGELCLMRSADQHTEAEACFQQALEVVRQQQAKSLELRVAMSLGRLWQRQGKCAAAYQLLAEVYGWFTEGFDTADLQEARALLETLGGDGTSR